MTGGRRPRSDVEQRRNGGERRGGGDPVLEREALESRRYGGRFVFTVSIEHGMWCIRSSTRVVVGLLIVPCYF